MRTCLENLMVVAALGQLVFGGSIASAQEKEKGAVPTAPSPAPEQESKPTAPAAPAAPAENEVQGQAVAEELESLYDDLLLDYINGQGGSVDELIQVHRMAIEAREVNAVGYRKAQIAWWGAATQRASQLARLIEQRYKVGGVSRTKVRIARANLELTKLKHAAAESAQQSAQQAVVQAAIRAERAAASAAQSAAKAQKTRASGRRVVLPPPAR